MRRRSFQDWKPCSIRFDAQTLSRTQDADLAAAGLSRPKIATLRAVEDASATGWISPRSAICRRGTRRRGLKRSRNRPVSAEVFLLFCLGHPDVFPAGDLALREAVRHAFSLEARPDQRETLRRAEAWRPCRGIAARLFWGYYRSVTGRGAGLPA
ncbi:MAG: hypothetical protein HPM95_15705 [Alphaproteobacteria bacterium]|nr:hypothetical protein [Alphaproteobacteria bacterium]